MILHIVYHLLLYFSFIEKGLLDYNNFITEFEYNEIINSFINYNNSRGAMISIEEIDQYLEMYAIPRKGKDITIVIVYS